MRPLAMRCACSLMLGWTLLLAWASRWPRERRMVAPPTLFVVGGIVVSEIAEAVAGVVDRAPDFARPSGLVMKATGLARYVWSCGVLLVPILAWNIACTRFLPSALASNEFSRDIPPLVTYGENILRTVVMVLPFLIPLEVATGGQRRGLLLFAVGTLLYFLAWVPLMIAPQSRWSTSWLGFVAPAYTPIVWLTGLGLIGRRLYVRSPYRRWMYIVLACGFVAFHVTHTSIVYARSCRHRAAAGARYSD